MGRVKFWLVLERLAVRWHLDWLGDRARTRRFRAQLRLQKLDVAKLAKGATSDERDAAVEEGVKAPKRVRRAKPPKAQREASA